MCGIIGYIGKNCEKVLLTGLKRLEYRGYDSAGMTVSRGGEFVTYKEVGEVKNLEKIVSLSEDFGYGIAHTRWATHGSISLENTHPHFSANGSVALVHNGIIENFEELKNDLLAKSIRFYGQTDSEVVAKMFDKLNINSLRYVLKRLVGSYALVLLSKDGEQLYFAKNRSPLYVARGEDCVMIASDPSCFVDFADSYFELEDGDYGKISLKNDVFYNKNDEKIEKMPKKIDFNFLSEDKSGYEHYMIKEIYQSRLVLESLIERYQTANLKAKLEEIKHLEFDRIYLVGCGTAYHAGLVGQSYLNERFNIDTFCDIASELPNKNYNIDSHSLCIFISQSGETADTISALKFCKERDAHIVALTNVEYSTIAHLADINLPIFAGQEKSVASTKAYFAQCVTLYILSCFLQGKDYVEPLKIFKNHIDFGDDNELKKLAKVVARYDKVFFIGRGNDYITSQEASLKLKEITYIFSTAVASGELKHGSLSLVDDKFLTVVISSDKEQFTKTLSNAYEIKSRGGKLLLITSLFIDSDVRGNFDYVLEVPKTENDLLPMQIILPLQKLAYFTACERGNNPDKPRNLAKSVTVE